MPTRILVAAPGFEQHVIDECLQHNISCTQLGDALYSTEDTQARLAWPLCIWHDAQTVRIDSIGHAAKILRELAPYWSFYPLNNVRRCQLIQDKLLKIKDKPFAYSPDKRLKSRGAFCLIDEHTMLYSHQLNKPYVDGIIPFEADRVNPPARAYLKIWEALTLLQEHPVVGEKVVELGAAPGAWTWCLADLGADCHSVDRAPLDPRIEELPNVFHRQCDAFALKPEDEMADWLCSDLICYPDRLIQMINEWLEHGHCQNYIITIKFQGDTDFESIKILQEIPNSWLIHLYNNKHEVTFIKHPNIQSNQMGPWQPHSR